MYTFHAALRDTVSTNLTKQQKTCGAGREGMDMQRERESGDRTSTTTGGVLLGGATHLRSHGGKEMEEEIDRRDEVGGVEEKKTRKMGRGAEEEEKRRERRRWGEDGESERKSGRVEGRLSESLQCLQGARLQEQTETGSSRLVVNRMA